MKKSKGVLPAVGKILLVLLGNTLYALAIALFVLPSGLITGGTTGLGLVAQHLLGLPLSGFVGIFNAAMFVVGLCLLGKVFALTTALSSFYFPLGAGALSAAIPGGAPHQRPAAGRCVQRSDDRRGNRGRLWRRCDLETVYDFLKNGGIL